MKSKLRWICPALLLAMLAPGASALAQPDDRSAEDLLASMVREGWKPVVTGVVQRQGEGGRVETFAIGPAASRRAIQELESRLELLSREYRAYPKEDIRRGIQSLQQKLSRLREDLKASRDEPLSSVMDKCMVNRGASADAYPLTPAGAGATASAYFNSDCAYEAETYASAYARAAANGNVDIVVQESPRTGTNISSNATASVQGTSNCLAEAYSYHRYTPANIFHSVFDSDTNCTDTTPPPVTTVGIGRIDDVPAATLLLPYFEVDLDDANGVTTLFSVNNASDKAVLAHVTLWTDQSVPAIDYDIYLTGFDVQTINLRDIFVNGNLSITASAGQDPADTISNKGVASQDINFASCTGVLPYANPAVSASFRAHLRAWFTGNQSPATGNCAGARIRDGIARGYVTIDTVNACNLLFPSSPGYTALLTAQNVLWGDYSYVHSGQNFAQSETLVHIEACSTCFGAGDHTFYGRYGGGDFREPLPTTLAARYTNGGAFNGGTDFLVWREGNQAAAGYSCSAAGPAAWYPLDAAQIVVFDEEENPVQQNTTCPAGAPNCVRIPNEAQRVNVAEDLLAPFDFGWVYLNLQHSKLTPYQDPYAQAWLMTVSNAEGRFSTGHNGIQLDNANRPITTRIPVSVP
ncbi:MAG TPA: hypothetical protein VEL74_14070 [Thermoanaerobaculia bacterium]|nr:hypothetical protein [Thermoanaerobaculia bacterium]